jgi:hypothetical protein
VCVSLLAESVPQLPSLAQSMYELLDLLFTGGLHAPLIEALRSLASNIKPMLPSIQGV